MQPFQHPLLPGRQVFQRGGGDNARLVGPPPGGSRYHGNGNRPLADVRERLGESLAACFDEGIDEDFVKELAKRQPLRAVFRDSGFTTDAVKINVEQIFKLMSPGTEVKSI